MKNAKVRKKSRKKEIVSAQKKEASKRRRRRFRKKKSQATSRIIVIIYNVERSPVLTCWSQGRTPYWGNLGEAPGLVIQHLHLQHHWVRAEEVLRLLGVLIRGSEDHKGTCRRFVNLGILKHYRQWGLASLPQQAVGILYR